MRKLITFSPELYRSAQVRAKVLGIGFAEYVRHLVIADTHFSASQTTFQPTLTHKYHFANLDEIDNDRELTEPFSEEDLDLME